MKFKPRFPSAPEAQFSVSDCSCLINRNKPSIPPSHLLGDLGFLLQGEGHKFVSDAVFLVAVRVRRLEVREGNQLTEIPYTVTVTCTLLFLIFGNYTK